MIAVFLPTRKGSERVLNKNTREFAGIQGGILQIKLEQLAKCKLVNKIILSSNDEVSLALGEKFASSDSRFEVIERPDVLALSSTSLIDLVKYVPTVCDSEHILWTHATSPFVTAEDYDFVIETYLQKMNQGYDSCMTAKKIQNFVWDIESNDLINRINNEKWPRTQDLKPLYEIDSAVFISSRENYIRLNDRVGNKPFLIHFDTMKSFDIDWEDDFKFAELLYKSTFFNG